MSILKKGMTGAPVKRMQEKLGIGADGMFGPGTEKAVKAFQEKSGLKADGIAGPDTFMAMGLEELVLLAIAPSVAGSLPTTRIITLSRQVLSNKFQVESFKWFNCLDLLLET